MSPILELGLGTEPIDRAEVDLAMAGFFVDERPLRGAVGRMDWRLCGLISQQLEAERLRGEPGEAVLLATFGRLAAPHVLALGLGDRAHFGRDDLRSHTRDAVGRAVRLGALRVALAPVVLSGADLAELADDLVYAALEALRSAGAVLRIRLLVERENASKVARALAETIVGSSEVTFEKPSEASPGSALPTGADRDFASWPDGAGP